MEIGHQEILSIIIGNETDKSKEITQVRSGSSDFGSTFKMIKNRREEKNK